MRMLTAIIGCVYSVLMMGGHAVAQPQPQVVTTVTAQQVVTVLQSVGYRASVATGTDGSKYVKSSMSGFNMAVQFFLCRNDNCESLWFNATFQKDPSLFTANFLNAWNGRNRFARGVVDDNGDFHLLFDVNLAGGVTLDNIAQNAQLFDNLISELVKLAKK